VAPVSDELPALPFGMSEPLVDQVRANLEITVRDIQKTSKWLLKGSRNVALRRWRTLYLGAALVFGFTLGALAAIDGRGWLLWVPLVVLGFAQARVQRALFSAHAVTGQGELRVDRTGFGLMRANGSSYWYPWRPMLEVTPTADHILIRQFDVQGQVIPRRCLAAGDAERILAFATDALSTQPPRS
jgi:YcxB-like protein